MKKAFAIILLFLLAFILTACSSTPEQQPDNTSEPDQQATEPAEAEPTEAPTAEPISAPTSVPEAKETEPAQSSSSSRLIEAAWPVAEKVMAKYGCEVDRDTYFITPLRNVTAVSFYPKGTTDMSLPCIEVYLEEEGGWTPTGVRYFSLLPEEYYGDRYERDYQAIGDVMYFDVTADDFDSAAAAAAELAAKTFVDLPEGNMFRCSDAAALDIKLKSSSDSERPSYSFCVALMPEVYEVIWHRYGEWSSGLCLDREYNMYVMVDSEVDVWFIEMNADGTYRMGVEFPADGPWG